MPPLTVGAVFGSRPKISQDERLLMRVVLPQNTKDEETVCNWINNTPALEVVEDPQGLYTEAIPYERIIVCGPADLKERLSKSLPRYFDPLAYRKLNFELTTAAFATTPSVLFGDALNPGLGRDRGHLHFVLGESATDLFEPDPGGGAKVARLKEGQSHLVAALSETQSREGLCWSTLDASVPNDAPDAETLREMFRSHALCISPGQNSPHVHLRPLLPPGREADRKPVLGGIAQTAHVSVDRQFGLYNATFGDLGLKLRIVPDSAFSRMTWQRRPQLDHLEILGLFAPMPGGDRRIRGVAVRFDADRNLLSDALRLEDARVVIPRGHKRGVLWSDGGFQTFGRKGAIANLGLRLHVSRLGDYALPPGWGLLRTSDNSAMGWIPLRLATGGTPSEHEITETSVQYRRYKWVATKETTGGGEAIYLDWLDHAVDLITPLAGEPHEIETKGLAEYCAEHPEAFNDMLFVRGGVIQLKRGSRKERSIRDGDEMRFGPLLVRAHINEDRGS